LRKSDFDPVSKDIFDKQLKRLTLIIVVVFSILILRFWFLQVVNGPMYRTKSENNRIRILDIPPFRGMILDRNGEIFVDNRPSYDLYVIPEEVQDWEKLIINLNLLTGLDPESVKLKLNKEKRKPPFSPVCLKRDMSRNELAKIESHRFNLPGIIVKIASQRHYIYGKSASHILGYLGEINEKQLSSGRYVGNKSGDLIGKSGVEKKWQKYLNGIRGGEQVEVEAAGRIIRVIAQKQAIPGANVCLTIDKDLQAVAEKAMIGKRGAIVAMDPDNGQILVMVSSPSFDPNLFVEGIDETTWKEMALSKKFPLQNRALAGQYSPGSVFKIVVALAGLEEGVIDFGDEVVCNGIYKLGRSSFRCWKRGGHGKVNLYRALAESCDVYFYKLGEQLGIDRISEYARKFGLGEATGIDIGQEKRGLVPNRAWKLKKYGESWQGGETLSTVIGQSYVLVTPIQMVVAVAAVFNGGNIFEPQITRWVGKNEAEKIYEFVPVLKGNLGFRQENLEIVKKALIGVVNDPHGTGKRARFKNVTVAGKTGTVQVVTRKRQQELQKLNKDNEIPYKARDHAWFVAVAPAAKPRIAIAVLVEHGGHGGSTAAPIAREIISEAIKKNYIFREPR